MKTFFTLISVLAISHNFQSQIALNSNEMTPFGTTVVLKSVLNFNIVDTNIQGPNVSWNFSAIIANNSVSDFVATSVDPAGTPYGSSFPNANYAFVEGPTLAYRYFNKTSTIMERVGSFNGGTLKTYTDPQIEYVFPMVYGSSSLDTWQNTSSTFGGTYKLDCIGTGELILPSGTFSAIMTRVKVLDGSFAINAIFWYDETNGSVLLAYYLPSLFTTESARYQSAYTLGLEEYSALSEFTYSNPVEDLFEANFVNYTGAVLDYSVVDMSGRILTKGFPTLNGELSSIKFHVSEFNSGVYLLTINNSGGEEPRVIRFIKK